MTGVGLAVSVVTYQPDLAMLWETLGSLRVALNLARREGALSRCRVFWVDNGPGPGWAGPLAGLLAQLLAISPISLKIV